MTDILYDQVPSLDLADFTGGDPIKREKFVADLGTAYKDIGFVAIRNHYLTDDLSARLYDVIKRFFALPDSAKQRYEIEGLAGQRGYIGKG
ncbi:MAG: 2-oxoglutarate and iron-dependent oxygenase domain-containing protein, partial [Cyclobacteriaceae bacterium]